MKRSIVQTLLLLYPAKWRNEYGAELEDLLLAEPLRFSAILNVMWNALRQQARPSNHPAGLIRPLARMTAGVGTIFVFGMTLSIPLWRLIVVSVTDSAQTPRVTQTLPFEAFTVLWLGLPLLITAFVGYPALLFLVRAKLAPAWTPLGKRWATAFAICSGSLFFLGGVSGMIAWQHGVALTLSGFGPLLDPTAAATVSACFTRCAGSILEFGILAQIPVLAVFMLRLKKGY